MTFSFFAMLVISFVGVNLDFAVILVLLLQKHTVKSVMLGYLLGVLVMFGGSFVGGQVLAKFLPEWVLGFLGLLPLYLAFFDDDGDDAEVNQNSVWAIFKMYLAVCGGCSLSLFIPTLLGQSLLVASVAGGVLVVLTGAIVFLLAKVSHLKIVGELLEKYGEVITKVVYVAVACYVFYDSGLLEHVMRLL